MLELNKQDIFMNKQEIFMKKKINLGEIGNVYGKIVVVHDIKRKLYMIFTGTFSALIVVYVIIDTERKFAISFLPLALSLFLLLWSCIIPGYNINVIKLRDFFDKKTLYKLFLLLYPLLIYSLSLANQLKFWGMHLVYFFAYISFPALLLFIADKTSENIQKIIEIFIAIALWIPFDHRYYRLFWPGKFFHGYNFTSLMVVLMIIILFLVLKKEDIGYNFIPNKLDFFLIAILTLGISIIVIPLGLLTGFLKFKADIKLEFFHILAFVGIFLTIGLVEEVIFRGIIQNLLEKIFKSHLPALLTTSVLFGLTHWNNADPGFTLHYIFLASIAGIFYGIAYKKSGSLFPAIFVHSLIDTLWLILFVK